MFIAFIQYTSTNTLLMNVQKHFYLKSSIEALKTTSENYDIAWEILENH